MTIHDMTDAQLVEHIGKQEKQLQFASFSFETAHAIGAALVARAKADALPLVVDVTRAGHCLFHVALPGATPDNAEWVLRKNRVVSRFHHSSLYMGAFCRVEGVTLEEKFLLPENTYAPHGGAFPITIRDTGVIGSVTVSGLPQLDDHALVTEVLATFV